MYVAHRMSRVPCSTMWIVRRTFHAAVCA
jgi:hypothetical protein